MAKRLGIPRLNLHGTGLNGTGQAVVPVEEVTGPMWLAARDTLARVAELGERHDVVFVLENLNRAVDHPGVPFARPPTAWRWSPRSTTPSAADARPLPRPDR